MGDFPFISIVIPTKNEEAFLSHCLESIQEQSYPKDRLEVIIADGLSTDNTTAIAEAYGAKVIKNQKQKEAPGRNVGFFASKGELIAFSDADCIMEKDWLANATKYFKEKEIGAVGGPIFAPQQQGTFASAVEVIFRLAVVAAGSAHIEKQKAQREVKHVPTCNAIYRRQALESVMPIDENLLTGDDLEISRRILQEGYKTLLVPDVCVWHHKRDTPLKFWRQMYRYAVARLQIGKKDFRWLHPLHIFVGLAFPLWVVLLICGVLLSPLLAYLTLGLTCISLLILFTVAIVQTRSMGAAQHALLALVILVTAWSSGFLRELFYPRKVTRR